MLCKILFSIFFITSVLLLIRSEIDVSEVWKTQAVPLGRHYSLTRCSFKEQAGCTCIDCNTALHCYPTNEAIQVECRGLYRYCRSGLCSMSKGEKCFTADEGIQAASTPVISDSGTTSEILLTTEDNYASISVTSRENKVSVDNHLENIKRNNNYFIELNEKTKRPEDNNLCVCP